MSAAPSAAPAPVRATSSRTQLRGLFTLRWQMVRSDGIRLALIFTVLGLAWLAAMVASGASSLRDPELATAVELAPQAFLGFGVLALIAPLTAGGGNEVVPPDQLVAYPVRPRTQFLGGLLLAPVNLVWVLQILALIAVTALLANGGNPVLASVTAALYVTSLTALGQALAWGIVGLRQSRRGRRGVALAGAGLLLLALSVVRAGGGDAVLDNSPTRTVVSGVVAGADTAWLRWSLTTAGLLVLTILALLLGARTCGWALRRPGDAGASRESKVVRRRRDHASPLRTLVALDRASVWRAPALRRGALVLAILPGVAAAGAAVPWSSLAVLPGLVAAGAGLLFGINAFCLDASGAVFVASLPHDPKLVARAKALVLGETVLAAVAIAALAGALRSPGTPTTTEVVTIVASGLACTAMVVSAGMAISVRRPHRAELKGPRDAVAPPGALTIASVRLAVPTGAVGVVMSATAGTGVWWLPVTLSVMVIALCALSLQRSAQLWGDPLVRARVVQRVSAG